ncbi:hypothetical protein [Paenibacillus sp. Y412MC10]|uniref:hypothetical protein n=1 Tax=Geobacillus sp. (strain Y412MC10) TaxID=481743 RepID=UPI00119F358B|nr:hypothetical protein [Paenibacillus sp. Y412MC10]
MPATKHCPLPTPVLAVLHSHRKDLTPPTRRWQQRSGRNHAGEAAAVAFVPEFLPSIPFSKNSGATAIGGMIRTRSGLPRTHALIHRALYAQPEEPPLCFEALARAHRRPHEACSASRIARASRTLCTKAQPYAMPRPCGAAQPPQGPYSLHSPLAAAERAESCRRSGSGRLCPRIFTFHSISKKFGGNSDRRHDPHAQRASQARTVRASRTLCLEAQPAPIPVLAVLHSHRKDLTPPLAAGSSGAGGIMPEKR